MLSHERILGASGLALKLATTITRAKVERKRGESTSLLNSFIFKDYSRLLSLGPKRGESLGVNRIVSEVVDYWFWADSYLDSQPLRVSIELGEVLHKGSSDQQRFGRVENTINESRLPQQIKEGIKNLIRDYKEKTIQSHTTFIRDFNSFLTPYEPVLGYRQQTTGNMAEMLVRIVGLSAGAKEENMERIMRVARAESLGLQMIDDMVDSVSDFGQLPNLFNALLLERPEEMKSFSEAISSQVVTLSKKPYQIAESFAPKTLTDYFNRFKKMIEALPKRRKARSLQFMAAATYCSFTPEKGKTFNLFSILSRGTKK